MVTRSKLPPRPDKRPPSRPTTETPANPLDGALAMRPDDCFRVLGVGHTFGWNLIKDGKLQVTRIGRRTLVHADSVRKLLGAPEATP